VGGKIPEAGGGQDLTSLIARLDSKGRIMLPKRVRDHLGLHPGDTLFLELTDLTLRCAKAPNPFDRLAEHAVEQHKAGKTAKLRDIIRSEQLDGE
jgi:AbrB family looped-hinge helix DNA binding protein